jgi:hypothetical protein
METFSANSRCVTHRPLYNHGAVDYYSVRVRHQGNNRRHCKYIDKIMNSVFIQCFSFHSKKKQKRTFADIQINNKHTHGKLERLFFFGPISFKTLDGWSFSLKSFPREQVRPGVLERRASGRYRENIGR